MLRIKEDNGEVDAEEVGSLIAQAYPERIARALDNIGNFRMANGNTVFIDKSDAMSAQEWIAIASLNSASCNEPASGKSVSTKSASSSDTGSKGKGFLCAPVAVRNGSLILSAPQPEKTDSACSTGTKAYSACSDV